MTGRNGLPQEKSMSYLISRGQTWDHIHHVHYMGWAGCIYVFWNTRKPPPPPTITTIKEKNGPWIWGRLKGAWVRVKGERKMGHDMNFKRQITLRTLSSVTLSYNITTGKEASRWKKMRILKPENWVGASSLSLRSSFCRWKGGFELKETTPHITKIVAGRSKDESLDAVTEMCFCSTHWCFLAKGA